MEIKMNLHSTEQYDLENEQWRDLVRYPQTKGFYWVSNLGRIKRFVYNKFYYTIGGKREGGYRGIQIHINGKSIATPRIHDLVADAFIRPINYGFEHCHHKNHFPWCNRLENLQILTPYQHRQDKETNKKISQSCKGRTSNMKGRKHSEQSKQKMRENRLKNPRPKDPLTGKFMKAAQ